MFKVIVMDEVKKQKYESPSTTRSLVEMEAGIMAASKEQVVRMEGDVTNSTVDILEQTNGGDFELDEWN